MLSTAVSKASAFRIQALCAGPVVTWLNSRHHLLLGREVLNSRNFVQLFRLDPIRRSELDRRQMRVQRGITMCHWVLSGAWHCLSIAWKNQRICQSLYHPGPMGWQEEEGRSWSGGASEPRAFHGHPWSLFESQQVSTSPPGATCPGRCQAEKAPWGFGRWLTWRVWADLAAITTSSQLSDARLSETGCFTSCEAVKSVHSLRMTKCHADSKDLCGRDMFQGWTTVLFQWFSRSNVFCLRGRESAANARSQAYKRAQEDAEAARGKQPIFSTNIEGWKNNIENDWGNCWFWCLLSWAVSRREKSTSSRTWHRGSKPRKLNWLRSNRRNGCRDWEGMDKYGISTNYA